MAEDGTQLAFIEPWSGIARESATMEEIVRTLGEPDETASGVTLATGSSYDRASYPAPMASVFLEDGKAAFVVLIEDGDEPALRTLAWWRMAFGEAEAILPSHRGKNHRIHLYARRGVAAVFDARKVLVALEYFGGTTPEGYKDRYYIEPPVFRK